MVTNDLGACEWFVWDLRKSGLIDRGQLDLIVSDFLKRNPRAEAASLAEHLVHQGNLTVFQAERILNSKAQALVLGPYVLLDCVGQGSMGQVYQATSKNDGNMYAVKVLPRRSMWNVRLARRQVRSFGMFQHPSVVPFVDVGTSGGQHYLAWPFVEGIDLQAYVQQHGPLQADHATYVGYQVAQGLAVCHQNNIFHGLLKPSNISLDSENQARILDFGIGSLLVENEGESLVDTMSTANTFASGLECASPESIMEPTNRTMAGDQYSLGCTLYYALTGQLSFPEESPVQMMMAHQTKQPTPIRELAPDVPEGLEKVVSKLMAKQPEDRYRGADEVVDALQPFLGQYTSYAAAAANNLKSITPPSRPGIGGGSEARLPGLTHLSTPGPRGGNRPSHYPTPAPSHSPAPRQTSSPYQPTPQGHPGLATPNPTPMPFPAAQHQAAVPPASVPPSGAPLPRPGPINLPGRNTFYNQAEAEGLEEVTLSAAAPETAQPNHPSELFPKLSYAGSTEWLHGPADDEEEDKPSQFGTIGAIASTLLIMVIVYFAAMTFLKPQ